MPARVLLFSLFLSFSVSFFVSLVRPRRLSSSFPFFFHCCPALPRFLPLKQICSLFLSNLSCAFPSLHHVPAYVALALSRSNRLYFSTAASLPPLSLYPSSFILFFSFCLSVFIPLGPSCATVLFYLGTCFRCVVVVDDNDNLLLMVETFFPRSRPIGEFNPSTVLGNFSD